MTKKAMVNEMVTLGCVKEADRNYLMKMTKDYIENIYKEVVPMRKAYLEKNN